MDRARETGCCRRGNPGARRGTESLQSEQPKGSQFVVRRGIAPGTGRSKLLRTTLMPPRRFPARYPHPTITGHLGAGVVAPPKAIIRLNP